MKPSSGREALLPAAEAVPVGQPVVGQALPPQAPRSPAEMYRDPVHAADGYWASALDAAPNLVLRERTYLSQMCFAACEKKMSYSAGSLQDQPPGQHLKDEDLLRLLAPGNFEIREESSCLCRYCLHQMREAKLGYFAPRTVPAHAAGDGLWEGGLAGFGWPEGEQPGLVFERPFKCTLCCCCCLLNPQEMRTLDGGQPIGGTVMEWECCMALCPYKRFAVHDARGEKEFEVHVPLLCADGCRNCCAPTCFNPVFHMPLTTAGSKEPVGSLENHWPGCNCRGLCSAGMANNNYVVRFPPQATAAQKARILSALHLVDFLWFERRANQK